MDSDKYNKQLTLLAYENYIQFKTDEWEAMQKENAEFIVSSANACISINPENPQAVVSAMKELYEAVRIYFATQIPDKMFEALKKMEDGKKQ